MRRYNLASITAWLLFIACASCNKAETHSGRPSYYFQCFLVTYLNSPANTAGPFYPGDTLSFGITLITSAKIHSLTLNYGDGDSTDTTFSKYVYRKPGQYTYILTVDTGLKYFTTGQITIASVPDSATLAQIALFRHWRGTVISPLGTRDTLDSFGITVLNPYTIVVNRDTLRYDDYIPNAPACYFFSSINDTWGEEFRYFPTGDSIYINFWTNPVGATSHSSGTWHSP